MYNFFDVWAKIILLKKVRSLQHKSIIDQTGRIDQNNAKNCQKMP